MNAELLIIKGAISELPASEQAKVTLAADAIRTVLKEYPDAGLLGLALVAAEQQEGGK